LGANKKTSPLVKGTKHNKLRGTTLIFAFTV